MVIKKAPAPYFFGFLMLLSLFLLTGCKGVSLERLNFLKPKPDFSYYLARGYTMLAEYENYRIEDENAGQYFELKAELAARGKIVEPGVVFADQNVSKSQREELQTARKALINALAAAKEDEEGSPDPLRLAEAQVNYDCWLMRTISQEQAAQYCRDTFYQVIGNIEVAAAEIPRTYSIFFHVGKATPDMDALNLIKQAAYAHALYEDWQVYLTGYTDSSGDRETNRILSVRRALAVRNALAQYGVDPGKIVVDAFGEEQREAVASPEESRRVDIRIEPAEAHRDAGSSHIEDIVPQFFN